MKESKEKSMQQLELATQLACMAYDEPELIHEACGLMGMSEFKFIGNEDTDTQVFCCRKGNKVYVSFRGTEFTNFSDWLTNLDFTFATLVAYEEYKGYAHAGFCKDVMSVYEELTEYLKFQGLANIEIIITGHSQGAGDATIFGLLLFLEDIYKIDRVVPVASPRCLSWPTAKRYKDTFGPLVHRVVNNNDIVTRIPTRTMTYNHVQGANFYYITEDGDIVNEISWWDRFKDRIKGRLKDFGEMGTDGLKDHDCFTGYLQQIREFNKRA